MSLTTQRVGDPDGEPPAGAQLGQLRAIVRGAEEGFPRASAMALLADTDYPNVHRDLAAVLLDESDLSRIRTAAAMTLWRLGSAEAASVLERSLAVEDERVLARVFTTLGRIGPSTALDAITEARRRTSGFARAQADFAATLIAHRFGLPGHKAVPPAANAFLAVPRAARPFRVSRADAAEAELGLRSLASEPFGIDLSERDAFRLRCDGNDWLLMLNADLSEAGGSLLADRKAVAAVIASKHQETGLYSTRFLVLTAPTRRRRSLAVTVHRGLGELLFAGQARVVGDELEFAVQTVKTPGAFPLRFSGTWTPGRLVALEAVAGLFVSVSRAPSAGIGPAAQDRSPPTPGTPAAGRKRRPS